MSSEQNPKTPENIETEPSDELEVEELDQVVGGGKKHTPPPTKPEPYMQITLENTQVSSV